MADASIDEHRRLREVTGALGREVTGSPVARVVAVEMRTGLLT
jgi:hypothetical protein